MQANNFIVGSLIIPKLQTLTFESSELEGRINSLCYSSLQFGLIFLHHFRHGSINIYMKILTMQTFSGTARRFYVLLGFLFAYSV